jgi:5-methylcytosine-specific restriction endonuclease McrA
MKYLTVLVLSQAYLPVNIVSWQKGISYIIQGRVEVIKEYNKAIRSASRSWNVPAVVRFLNRTPYVRKIIKMNRHNIFARDSWNCQYCNESFKASDLTLDHLIPISRGGKSSWKNLVTCCGPCNTKKGSHLLIEIGMRINKLPKKPKWTPMFALKMSNKIPSLWKEFI